jgi:hypothetical protein
MSDEDWLCFVFGHGGTDRKAYCTGGLARIHLYWSFIAVSGLGRFIIMLYPHGIGYQCYTISYFTL